MDPDASVWAEVPPEEIIEAAVSGGDVPLSVDQAAEFVIG